MTDDPTLPHFVVIGAMKCGTTTLASQLAAQDGVFITTPKEPNYFSDDDIFAQGEAWYRGLFSDAPEGALRGEASTHYTKRPTHPKTIERMTALLPDAKLVYMIRNPLARAISHYIHDWSLRGAGSDWDTALRSGTGYIEYGCYGMQIAPFLEAYGENRVFLTCLEAVKADPDGEFRRIASFLGLPETAHWVHDLDAQNVSGERFRRLPFQSLLVDNPIARGLRRTLVPKSVRDRIRAGRQMTDRPELPDDLKAKMIATFTKDREQLARFFPDHPALDLAYPFLRDGADG